MGRHRWYRHICGNQPQVQSNNFQRGFTYIELLIVIGVSSVLFGLVAINLSKAQRSTSTSATVETLVSDIKSQQLKAMMGATEGRTGSDTYGLYFQSGSYTLFHGMTYFPADTANFVVTADSATSFSTTLPNGLLIFSKISGEMAGWTSGQNTITVRDTSTNTTKTITLNRYGVISSIQ